MGTVLNSNPRGGAAGQFAGHLSAIVERCTLEPDMIGEHPSDEGIE
jgi:hypothetical protein